MTNVHVLLHYYKIGEVYKSLLISVHANEESAGRDKTIQEMWCNTNRDWLEKDHWFEIQKMELLDWTKEDKNVANTASN